MSEIKGFDLQVDNLVPQGDFMLVEPMEYEGDSETKGGIIIPNLVKQATPTLAKVVKAGPDAKYKEGDIVIFRRYSLDEISVSTPSGKKVLHFVETDDIISQYKIK